MILFYDHLLTFGDEVQYIWSAPSTYAKYIFLLNRYTVLGILIAVAYGKHAQVTFQRMLTTDPSSRDVRLRGHRIHGRGMYDIIARKTSLIVNPIAAIVRAGVSTARLPFVSQGVANRSSGANSSYSHAHWWLSSRSVLPTFSPSNESSSSGITAPYVNPAHLSVSNVELCRAEHATPV